MLSETIKIRLQEKFDAPLPEFYKRRIVFWHDEDKEFGEDVNGLSLPGVSVVRLTGRNNFAVKKLLSGDDLTGGLDSILSILQMPSGIPVAVMPSGKAGGALPQALADICRLSARALRRRNGRQEDLRKRYRDTRRHLG